MNPIATIIAFALIGYLLGDAGFFRFNDGLSAGERSRKAIYCGMVCAAIAAEIANLLVN